MIAEAHRQAVAAVHAERGEAHTGAFDEAVNRRFLREMGAMGGFVSVQSYTGCDSGQMVCCR